MVGRDFTGFEAGISRKSKAGKIDVHGNGNGEAVFLNYCPDYPSCLAHLNIIDLTTWAI